jgi:hypothetical protein
VGNKIEGSKVGIKRMENPPMSPQPRKRSPGRGACFHLTRNRRRRSIRSIVSLRKRGTSNITIHYAERRREVEIKIEKYLVEIIHSRRSHKYKGMVIKLDMENAFDRVKHSFLFSVLKAYGFS